MPYTIYSADTAPEAAREILAAAKRTYGFIPNLLGCMGGAPALLKAYTTLSRLFDDTSLEPTERQVVLLTVSHENRCGYCMAAHSVIAAMQHVPADVIDAIRDGRPITDRRLEALRRFTAAVVSSRGWPAPEDTKAFFAVGYGPQQVLEVVLGVGMKTLSNYTNHLAGTPVDDAFAKAVWPRAA